MKTTESYCTVGPFGCEPPEKRWNVQRDTWNERGELVAMSRYSEHASREAAMLETRRLNIAAFRAGRHRAPAICSQCSVPVYTRGATTCVACEDDRPELERFEVRCTDPVGDPELVCLDCGAVLCNVEVGDSLAVLVRCAEEHMASKHRRRADKCRPSDEEQEAARAETGED